MWQDCQLKAKFHYIDLLPRGPQNAKASFGSCMHKALEILNKTSDLKLAVDTFTDNWDNPEKLGVTPEVWPKMTTFGGLRDRGIRAIKDYAGVVKWDDRTVVATEHEFLVPFGKHELHGFVDLLDERKSGKGKNLLRVTDYKTNSRRPNIAELGLNIQFSVYDFASRQREFWTGIPNGEELFEKYDDKPRRNIWFHLWDAIELDAGSRDDDDFERLYQLCESIEKAHEHEVFVPRIGEACLYCPYTEPCGIKVPTKEELLAESDAWT